MNSKSRCDPTRRALFLGGGAFALATSLSLPAASVEPKNHRVTAASARVRLAGASRAETAVWAYDGTVPGPVLRLRQGEGVRIAVENRLDQETTVHWHGLRVPNAMDGVPGLTQPPIKPGESFVYTFTPPDAGTFWYHPHTNSLEQLSRGLAGAVIVEEREPLPVDRDLLWFLADWRLTSDLEIAPGFGGPMDAAMSGRVGNLVTLNGARPEPMRVSAGERLRLRLINAAAARIMALRFEDHHPIVVALDGQPCEPHEPDGGRVLLGPAMRVDLVLDMQGDPGKSYRVVDDFYDGMADTVTQLAYADGPPIRLRLLDALPALPRNPLPEPDLATAESHELVLRGGMMGGRGMAGMSGMTGGGVMGGMMGTSGAAWAINGMSMTGDGQAGMKPSLIVQRGRSLLLTLRNETAWWHPMHLHGHSLRVLSRNGQPVPHHQWQDTVLMAPKESVEVAFVADNPGDWMLHCHVMDHQMAGLMTVLRVA